MFKPLLFPSEDGRVTLIQTQHDSLLIYRPVWRSHSNFTMFFAMIIEGLMQA